MMSEPCVKQFTFCNTNNIVQYQWHASLPHMRNDDHMHSLRSAVAAQYKYYEWQHNIQPIYTYR